MGPNTTRKKGSQKHFQISDKKEIEKLAQKVVKENKKAVEDYKNGEQKSLNFLIGQVMKLSDNGQISKLREKFLKKF